MPPRAPHRRSLPPLFLALVLLAGSSVAASGVGSLATRPVSTSADAQLSAAATDVPYTPIPDRPPSHTSQPSVPVVAPTPAAAAKQHATVKPATPKPTSSRRPAPTSKPPSSPVYRGTNHLWIPSLGINRSVGWYSCGNPRAPGLGVYRWGCAGRNNTYLLAHAYAAFKPLHDAYVQGRLRKGMKAIYADGSGHIHTYAVVWWRLTTPDDGAFAYAAQSRPSMTLQTCVGSRSQYRLIVRLVAVS